MSHDDYEDCHCADCDREFLLQMAKRFVIFVLAVSALIVLARIL